MTRKFGVKNCGMPWSISECKDAPSEGPQGSARSICALSSCTATNSRYAGTDRAGDRHSGYNCLLAPGSDVSRSVSVVLRGLDIRKSRPERSLYALTVGSESRYFLFS